MRRPRHKRGSAILPGSTRRRSRGWRRGPSCGSLASWSGDWEAPDPAAPDLAGCSPVRCWAAWWAASSGPRSRTSSWEAPSIWRRIRREITSPATRASQTTTWTPPTRMPRPTTTWAATSAETTSADQTGAGRSIRARRLPEVDPAFSRVPVDVFQIAGRKLELLERACVLLQLGHAAGPDQRRRDAGVAQGPGQRHLRQRLTAPAGDLMEAPHLRQDLFRQQIGRKRTRMAGSRAGPDASKASGGEAGLRGRGEDNAADSLVTEYL